jgi:hypothetical protein
MSVSATGLWDQHQKHPEVPAHNQANLVSPLTRPGRQPDQRASTTPTQQEPAHGQAGNGAGNSVPSWPLLILALPSAIAVWSGWVGIGQMTGFWQVHPLPGIWSSLHLNTAVTPPVGVEAYAAYALRAWLSPTPQISARTHTFARWSAIGSLLLGMAGQVAYHLLSQARAVHAPWVITTAVSCLPVLVLGMGAGLAHMLRADARLAQMSARAAHCLSATRAPARASGRGRNSCKVSATGLRQASSTVNRQRGTARTERVPAEVGWG